jgi:hypothetical protein
MRRGHSGATLPDVTGTPAYHSDRRARAGHSLS